MQIQVGEKGHEIINTKAKEGLVQQVRKAEKSGSLVFCGGKTQVYTLEQLMRASAELLGRGTIGTTYKAVLDNQLIVTVKRLDASKTAITSSDVFERHMDVVGALRHPNLVPIAAYFQAKGERLVIFDYQPNGSLFNLIHGITLFFSPFFLEVCLGRTTFLLFLFLITSLFELGPHLHYMVFLLNFNI
jgi:hypothetical protein